MPLAMWTLAVAVSSSVDFLDAVIDAGDWVDWRGSTRRHLEVSMRLACFLELKVAVP